MFDQTPIQERHAAIGVFAAIGLSAFGAFYLLKTGGFAPILPERAEAASVAQPAYVRVVQSDWAPPSEGRVTPTAYVVGDAYAADYPVEPLVGDRDTPLADRSGERSYEDVTRDIAALYQETSVYRAGDYGDAIYADDQPNADDFVHSSEGATKNDALSDDGSASPW